MLDGQEEAHVPRRIVVHAVGDAVLIIVLCLNLLLRGSSCGRSAVAIFTWSCLLWSGREGEINSRCGINHGFLKAEEEEKVSQCRVLGKDLIVLLTDIWWCWEFVSGEDVSVVLLGLAANSTVIGGGSWFMIRIIIGNWLLYI